MILIKPALQKIIVLFSYSENRTANSVIVFSSLYFRIILSYTIKSLHLRNIWWMTYNSFHLMRKTCKRGYSTRLNLENSTKESSVIEFRQVLCPYPIWGHGLSLLYFDSKVFSRTEPDK